MGFPESILTSDEAVVRHLHPHWKTLIVPVFWLLVVTGGFGGAWWFLAEVDTTWAGAVSLALIVVALVAVGALSFWPWLCWRTTHYVFTTERVIVRDGVISRSGRDIPLARVNDVSFSHGIVDRMLGCGRLTIESAGERGQVVLVDVPGVETIQSVIYELVEADRDRHGSDGSTGADRKTNER